MNIKTGVFMKPITFSTKKLPLFYYKDNNGMNTPQTKSDVKNLLKTSKM